jgi:hypothetical protein
MTGIRSKCAVSAVCPKQDGQQTCAIPLETGSVAAGKTVSVLSLSVVAVMVIWAVVGSLAFLTAKLRMFG